MKLLGQRLHRAGALSKLHAHLAPASREQCPGEFLLAPEVGVDGPARDLRLPSYVAHGCARYALVHKDTNGRLLDPRLACFPAGPHFWPNMNKRSFIVQKWRRHVKSLSKAFLGRYY